MESHIYCCFVEKERKKSGGNMEKFCFGWICLFIVRWTRDFVGFWFFWRKIFDQKRQKNMGVQNQIYAHKIKLVGGTKRVVEKSRILDCCCGLVVTRSDFFLYFFSCLVHVSPHPLHPTVFKITHKMNGKCYNQDSTINT